MRRLSARIVLFAITLACGLPLSAARRDRQERKTNEPKLSERFEGLTFRSIGPYRGGRSTAVTGVRGDPFTFYFGSSGGGVWKTTDGGSIWEPMSDKDFQTGSVGAVAVAESDPNVVYAGTGESPIRGNLSSGDGVYRSTDAGKTWKKAGLDASRQIARIVINPKDPNLVYAAAQGDPWAPSAERGVYRSEDGGATWKRVLFVDDKTGACDLSMDPGNPRILFAAFWQAVRRPWDLVSGGPGSGLYRSADGGDSWKKLSKGLPDGVLGRIGVSVSGAQPGRVWAIVEADKGGVFRSDDGGDTWKRVNGDHKLRERAWYYSWIYADPKNPNTVWVPNVVLYRSIDGGSTFEPVSAPHGDNHAMWIDPDDSDRLILGNDGGATISFNGGRTWSTQDNQPTAQFYTVITDNRFPYWVYGAQQDNGTVGIPSAVRGAVIDQGDWHDVGYNESGWVAPDPRDPDIVYSGGYGGSLTRYDHHTHQYRQIDPWPQLGSGHATRDLKYRFNWTAPLLLSKHDPTVLYYAAQKLMKSTDEGQTWKAVSPDLTRNDVSKQGYSGGPITHDISGVEVYDTIFALAESPLDAKILWAGSDDGLVHVTRDGGTTWSNVTPPGLPEWIQINRIEASPVDAATAFVAATMYKFDDDRPYLYRTGDYGKTWTKIVDGIPDGSFTRVIRQDPVRPDLLYAGTERGIYFSFDGGRRWEPFQQNLPRVPVTDLAVKDDDLVVATQGRSFWILDDVGPLRQWKPEIERDAVYLFPPATAYRIQTEKLDEEDTRPIPAGTNAPNGVVVDYWLREKPAKSDKISIEVLAGDKVLRKFTNEKPKKEHETEMAAADETEAAAQESGESDKEKEKPLEPKAGLNRFVWDMRIFKPTLAPKTVFNEGSKEPPKVAPGTYTVRLSVNGRAWSRPAVIEPHPGAKVTAADLRAQYDLLYSIQGSLSQTHETVLKVREVRAQVRSLVSYAKKLGKAEGLEEKAKALDDRLAKIGSELTNPKIQADEDDLNYIPKLDHDFVYLAGVVSSADARPTESDVEYYGVLKDRLAAVLRDFQTLVDGDLAEFNRAVKERQIPPIVVPPEEQTVS